VTVRASALPPVCILAGGVGSRLGEAVGQVPKPMLPVAGRPFLFHQLELLAREGAHEVVLCIGYLGDVIRHAVGDGSAFGLRVAYSDDGGDLLGTAGAVRQAIPRLGERFMVLYGDTYLRIDYADVDRVARESDLPALMTVLRNEGRWDVSNVRLAGDRVERYDKVEPDEDMTHIDYGLSVLEAGAVMETEPGASDLSTLFTAWATQGRLAAYVATERFFEIGTPESWAEASAFLAGGSGR